MAPHNIYHAYKRDTSHLVHWIVQVSNRLIATLRPDDRGNDNDDTLNSIKFSTTGGITASSLLPLCTLIAKHIKHDEIPLAVFRLFRSIIDARTSTHASFQQLAAESANPAIQENNVKHKLFIDTLIEAFEILGGKLGEASDKAKFPAAQKSEAAEQDDLDELLFFNRPSALSLQDTHAEASGKSDEEPQKPQAYSSTQQRRQARPRKGKEGRSGKQQKKKQKQPVVQPALEDVPLESYRIIQDPEGAITDYHMALYALVQEWTRLRQYIQDSWRQVAYENMNSAIAGTLSNVAIAMIRRSVSEMFVDFPGHESYETVMKTITRGNAEKAQGMLSMGVCTILPDGWVENVETNHHADVKEHFLINAYQDLLDFVTDFQRTRSGKPTKRILESIQDWNPKLDLQQASKQERLKWRRAYTINWLYDLVNLFSSVVVQRNAKGENHPLEKVDWSVKGSWDGHRRIYGLKEFAGFVTSLAVQKQGTDVRNKILPQHVFQLQCIVDSFAVPRGWSVHPLKGDILTSPAPRFRPRRDVDLFLDRENKNCDRGFAQGVEFLKKVWKDEQSGGKVSAHGFDCAVLKDLQHDFVNWLGETKYMSGLTGIPPWRFTSTNSNGLWEYSPFLCGVGLTEALEIAYRAGMWIWDRHHEVLLMVHIHNMLLQKGFIKKPIGLFQKLQDLTAHVYFPGGKIPTSHFHQPLLRNIKEAHRAEQNRKIARSQQSKNFAKEFTNYDSIRMFKEKSALMACSEAEWDIDRVSDTDIPFPTILGTIRLARTKQITDPVTGQKRLEDTVLVRRLRTPTGYKRR